MDIQHDMDYKNISNYLRLLSLDMIETAKSGHPGLPLGAAPIMTALYCNHFKHNPKNPKWFDRDRFVLSAGHGSALLYSSLYTFGYDLSIEDLKKFRQLGSNTPGHPESHLTPGVEVSTGPLGQGIANAVGLAMAERYLAEKFNTEDFTIVDHMTYCLVGDGCLMEGLSYEAASLAGHLKLNKLCVLYDCNNITIEGSTDITFTEDIVARFEAQGFFVQTVPDGNDEDLIDAAIEEAKNQNEKPSLIIIKTKIGHGSPKEDTPGVHGSPLNRDEINETIQNLEFDLYDEVFKKDIPFVTTLQETQWKNGALLEQNYEDTLAQYQDKYPDKYEKFKLFMSGATGDHFEAKDLPALPALAGRTAGSEVLQRASVLVPNLIGGTGDVGPSTQAIISGKAYFTPESFDGSNINFGIREHAMAAIANGMAAHGGVKPFVSAFLAFSDYAKPALRMAALMELPVIHIYSHDSLFVGEDGPTHEPIEHITSMRLIPNVTVIRPADSKEVGYAYEYALKRQTGPTVLILSREGLPLYDTTGEGTLKGGYVLKDYGTPEMIIIATGSDLRIADGAAQVLSEEGIGVRVVSMPSMEIFEKQADWYKEEVLPSHLTKRLAIEMGVTAPWYKYVGLQGKILGIDTFGMSGKGAEVAARFGFTVDNAVNIAKSIL